MAVGAKSYMLVSLSRPRPLLHPSFAATKIRVAGRRYMMKGLQVSASLPPSLPNISFSASAKTLPDSCNYYDGDDEDFVDEVCSWNCIGSSHGWLGYINPGNLSFYLFKPSLLNDPSYLPYIVLPPIQFASDDPNAISKMAFSSFPSPIHRQISYRTENENSSVVVVITLDWVGPAAAFCRIGDPTWTTLATFPVRSCSNNFQHSNNFQDMTSNSKHKLFYLITDSGEIYSWDLSNYHYCPMKQQQQGKFRYLTTKPRKRKFAIEFGHVVEKQIENCKHYLVMDESSGALIVIRLQHRYSEEGKVYMRNIHRLDLDSLRWFRVMNLVYTALFIGRNNGIAVDVRQCLGLVMPGYIYLASYDANVFQVTALTPDYFAIPCEFKFLRAEMTTPDARMTSFPVWNFG